MLKSIYEIKGVISNMSFEDTQDAMEFIELDLIGKEIELGKDYHIEEETCEDYIIFDYQINQYDELIIKKGK